MERPAGADWGKMALPPLREMADIAVRRMDVGQLSKEVRSTMPFLVPFLKMTCIYFVLWLDKGTLAAATVKCLPLLSLIWFVCLLGVADPVTHGYNRRIAIALAFCCAGDFFLVWSELSEIYFLLGLACFAVGHLIYSLAFGWAPFGRKELIFTLTVGIPVLAGVLSCVNGFLKYAAAVYGVLLLIMEWRALARFSLQGVIPWRKIYAAVGATLFVASDTILAVNKFCCPVSGERYLIMVSYYAAQFFIALSVVNSALLKPARNSCSAVARGDKKSRNFPLNRTVGRERESSVNGVNLSGDDVVCSGVQKNGNDFRLNGTDREIPATCH